MAETTTYNRYSWLLAACVIAVVVLAGNWPLLIGRAAPAWAGSNYYGPLFSLVADHAKAGKLFLWNPWMNGGTPDFADPQEGAVSPILLLFAIVFKDSLTGYIVYWMTAWIFGGLGMLLLCRHLKCPPWGGLIAALGFVACGYYTGHAQHMSFLYVFSYIPWIVWRFDEAIVRRSYWTMVQTGVLWGLSGLGGYPALVILDPMFLVLWAIGRIWLTPDELEAYSPAEQKKLALFSLAGLCLLGIIGAAIMSPSYLALVKFAKGYSFRTAALDRHRALTEEVLPPQALGTFASPYLYLLNWPGQGIWPESDISMCNIYMGVLVVSLAAMALTKLTKWRLWLGLIVLLSFACAVGIHSPVRGWLYALVPPTRYFRHSSLFSAYGILGCCVLAAVGARNLDIARLAQHWRERRRFLAAGLCVAIAAGLAYVWILRVPNTLHFNPRNPTILFAVLWLSVVVVLFLWAKHMISGKLLPVALVLIAIVDAGSTLHASRKTIYSAEYLSWWNLIKARHVQSLDLTPNGFTRTLYPSAELGAYEDDVRNIVVKQEAFTGDTGLRNQFFPAYVHDPVLSQLVVGSQRIWFSDHPVWVQPTAGSFAAYVKASHSLGVPPLVLHTVADMLKSSDLTVSRSQAENDQWIQLVQPVSRAQVDLIEYHPNSLSFRYDAERDGWLLITDRWAPSWKAKVNGRRTEVVGANFLFRAVPVARGENIVQFKYAPVGYVPMVVLSWSILSIFSISELFRCGVFKRASLLNNRRQRYQKIPEH